MRKFYQVLRNNLLIFIVSLFVILLDQITKFAVVKSIPLFDSIPEDGIIRLTHIENTGSAFGFFQGMNFFLAVFGVIGIAFILYFYKTYSNKDLILTVALAFVLGGAIGNLTDRIYRGAVVDFIDVELWNGIHFPSFNIADSALSLGAIVIVVYSIYRKYYRNNGTDISGVNKFDE